MGGVSVSPCHRTARVSLTSPLGPPLVIDGGLRFFGHSERGAMLERRRRRSIARLYDPFALNSSKGRSSSQASKKCGSSTFSARTGVGRSEEHTYALQSLIRLSYAVFSFAQHTDKN